ncbi:hypothetical protein BDN71DRAFT_1594463 [Pleurotus eryngii]|uniref:peptidylprolyl isomerase n=1 Tax=Pleurotus eryngii TaxID=5323 RepID=A0A9P5ZGY0_PLEER|nr:hypothetical protein BDN71DRAFT_1594463 [Pleurotus eryngii]
MRLWVLNIPPNSRSDTANFDKPVRVTNLAFGSVIEGKGRCAVDIHIGPDVDNPIICHLGALTPGKVERFGLDLILDADTDTIFLNHGGQSSVCLSGYFMSDTSSQDANANRDTTPSRFRGDSVDSVAGALQLPASDLFRTESMESVVSGGVQTQSRAATPLARRNSSLSLINTGFHPLEKPAAKGRKRKVDDATDDKASALPHKRKPVTRSGSATIPSARAAAATASTGSLSSSVDTAASAVAPTVNTAAVPAIAAPAIAAPAVAAPAIAAAPFTFTLANGVKCTDENKGELTGPAVRNGDDVEIFFLVSLPGWPRVPWFDVRWLVPPAPSGFKFTVGDPAVIEGLNTGIVGMHRWGERNIEIPRDLAFQSGIPDKTLVYGAKGRGVIPANSKILFRVKLNHIIPRTA